MIRRRSAVLLLLLLPALALAQAPRRAPQVQGLQAVVRALLEGRYEEVDTLADKLDMGDPALVALKARAAIERGRYADAEAMLRGVVDLAPTSEAALELGLLQKMLGRSDAAVLLERVALLAGRSNDPTQVARGARAPGAWPDPGCERRLPRRRVRRAQRSGDQHRMGRAVPRDIQQERGAEVVFRRR